jgi:hypothetical protein
VRRGWAKPLASSVILIGGQWLYAFVFVSREFGFGRPLPDDELEKINTA